MSRIYHNCHLCGGKVSERNIRHDYHWGNELIAIIENVPAGVCENCGEPYFKADVVKEMERLVRSQEKPKKMITVPCREFAAGN
ncbi:MAG: type II toxin-antitoxin system MqsA family antitoxin [Desulfococcaceae bacterium]|nr:type II toxin-antitoxin system MqsA family antitoxin [Desulfococcaceae bacterium]